MLAFADGKDSYIESFINESNTHEIFTPSNHSLPDSYPMHRRFSVDLYRLGKGYLFYVRNSKRRKFRSI
jgi:hypothetical protein